MQILISLVETIGIIVVAFFIIVAFLKLSPLLFHIDVFKEIKTGNIAVSIFALGLFIFVGFIIGFLVSTIF